MDTRELETALRGSLGGLVRYWGVFSSDDVGVMKLPLTRERGIIFIVNTLESTSDINNVGHWVCFHVSQSPKRQVVFFDSYGIDPEVYGRHFSSFFKINSSFTLYTFKRQIQPDLSYKCGLYVLFFIHSISHHGIKHTLARMKSTFSSVDLHRNDRWVVRYYFTNLRRRGTCGEWRSGVKRAITYSECLRGGGTGMSM